MKSGNLKVDELGQAYADSQLQIQIYEQAQVYRVSGHP